MMRVLQGDVGSGKTIVSLISAFVTVKSGYQVAFLCPTELLAKQHYQLFKKLLISTNCSIQLLSGKLKNSEQNTIRNLLSKKKLILLLAPIPYFRKKLYFKI